MTNFLKSDDVYLEAQIQNTTVDRPLCLDKVTMEPSSLFEGELIGIFCDNLRACPTIPQMFIAYFTCL